MVKRIKKYGSYKKLRLEMKQSLLDLKGILFFELMFIVVILDDLFEFF